MLRATSATPRSAGPIVTATRTVATSTQADRRERRRPDRRRGRRRLGAGRACGSRGVGVGVVTGRGPRAGRRATTTASALRTPASAAANGMVEVAAARARRGSWAVAGLLSSSSIFLAAVFHAASTRTMTSGSAATMLSQPADVQVSCTSREDVRQPGRVHHHLRRADARADVRGVRARAVPERRRPGSAASPPASVACCSATSSSARSGTPKIAATSRISSNDPVERQRVGHVAPAPCTPPARRRCAMPSRPSVARSPAPSAEKFDSQPA